MPDEWQYPHPPHGLPPRGPAGVSPPPPPPAAPPATASDAVMRLEALRLAVQAYAVNSTNNITPLAERYFKWIKTGEWA